MTERDLKWFNMPFEIQIGNIGSEVSRAIRYKNKQNEQAKMNFYNKAVELLERSQRDPKNIDRIDELEFCKEELNDYFFGSNDFNSTDESLMKYYDAFL